MNMTTTCTFRRQLVHVADPEKATAVYDLLTYNCKAVYITFLTAFRRATSESQQFGSGPQLRCTRSTDSRMFVFQHRVAYEMLDAGITQ